jgi:hypothetical protein
MFFVHNQSLYLMRIVLLSILMLGILSVTPAFAQSEPTREPSPSALAYVNLSGGTLVQSGRSATITFTFANAHGVQPGVRYGILLTSGDGEDAYIVDEQAYDEELTLREGMSETRTVVYTAPGAFAGEYNAYVILKNDAGFVFGLTRAGALTLGESESPLALDIKSCYLTKGARSTRVDEMKPIVLAPNETLTSHCTLTNTSSEVLTLTPSYETRAGSLFGPLVTAEGGSPDTITLGANEERTLETPLPRATAAGTYAVTLGYDAEGNDVTYTYTIGTPAHIENVLLDADTYSGGKTAAIGLTLRGEGTYTLAVDMKNGQGESCGDTVYRSVSLSGTIRTDVPMPITSSCASPEVTARLTDSTNALASEFTTKVTPLPTTPVQEVLVVTDPDPGLDFGPTFFISIIALAIGLGIFYHSLYTKGKVTVPTTPLVLLIALLLGFTFAPEAAHARTFTQNDGACTVSIGYDPMGPHIRTGDTLTVSGYTSCPGLKVDAVLTHAGTAFSATANSFGALSGTFLAPAADDIILYVSGDTFPSFSGYPVDYIFVNYCPPGYLEHCELPPGGSIFGEKVGWSGGACGAGSTGTCNYTCQSDLTWKKNSNTCTAPPPPPPSSTAEFTSTPSCTIPANASSCSTTVGVFVPSTYFIGVELITAGGTFVQTVPPGNNTVSVTMPYGGETFNLRPPFSTVISDSVTGTATCASGTSWNGRICAPLPPPAVPTGLAAQTWGSCGAKTIKVSWNTVPGATSYELLRDGVTLIPSILTNEYVDTVAVNGSSHTYQVRARNASGPSVTWSASVPGSAPIACVTSGSFTILTCAIPAGQNSCSATVGWTSNAVTPNVLQNNTSFSTAQSNPGTPRTVTYGTNPFVLRDGGTTLDTKNVSIGCASGTSWNGSTCEVSTTPPSTRPCAGTEILGCQLDPTAHGSTDGTCNPATYTGTCSYTCNDGTWGAPSSNNCTTISTPPPVVSGPPTLTTNALIVRQGTTVTLNWDTNNGNETLCRLTGGTVNLTQLPAGGNTDPETGSVTTTVNARTTYTLDCGSSGRTSLTIDIIPSGTET